MGELKPLSFAWGASGAISSGLREKMETHYEKDVKEQIIRQYQPEASTPSAYKSEFSQEEKERILKDIYSCIKLFYTIVCEVKSTPNSTSASLN